jgi:uncharacterized protein YbaR (Trm112 family)
MALDPELIKILACPDCRGEIVYSSKKTGDKLKEELKCKKCKRVFEVKDGIPIMLPKEEMKD